MKKQNINEILKKLDNEYGTDDRCYLNYMAPHELLIATIMSAQCTDARVNMVTDTLFKKYRSVDDFADADLKELEEDIRTVGFYHMKAEHIIGCCKALKERYDGEVPEDIDKLTTLPGVGRKTANVVRGHIFRTPSIVVDTHVKRVSNRLGMTHEHDPEKIEFDLMKKIPEDHWILINLQLIRLGREICHARKPECQSCFLKDICPSAYLNL